MTLSPQEILKQHWGYDQFRPRQLDIIQSLLAGNDTLALLPTGGGKSICFQVPALCNPGLCLVISPLMALMYDQVENLKKRNIPAFAVTSAMNHREIDRILDNSIYGDVKFLYVSPERLQNELFLERLKKMKLNMIAVDEAHCISQWGYDFRPQYLKIADIRPLKPGVPILALTASATPTVVSDIQHKLLFAKENVIGTSFARKNLIYSVLHEEDKEARILKVSAKIQGCGIVYCGTRHRTKEMAVFLQRNNITALPYHAGMTHLEKSVAFQKWMKNEVRFICATNAFGMGIDKPDVKIVMHADVPPHPEAYFQEAGRAGRDGQKAYALLMYNEADLLRLEQQLERRFPPREYIAKVYLHLCNHLQIALGSGQNIPHSFQPTDFARKYDLQLAEALYAMEIMELSGYLTLSDATYIPSRVMFRLHKQDLYSYQVANPAMDMFIKLLLRMYGGLFEQFVNIRESEIARVSKLPFKAVVEKLKILAQHQVLDYEEQNDIPKITLLTGRQKETALIFPPEVYEQRKKSETERMHAMQRYLEKNRCRSIQLLEYFGEKNVAVCGECDVCRETKKHGLSPEEYEKMNLEIIDIVLKQRVSIEAFPALLPGYPADHLLEFIRWKLDNGELELDMALKVVLPGMDGDGSY